MAWGPISADLARLAATVTEVYKTVEISFSDHWTASVCLDRGNRPRIVKYSSPGHSHSRSWRWTWGAGRSLLVQLRVTLREMGLCNFPPRVRLHVVAFFADALSGYKKPGVLAKPWVGLMLVEFTIYEYEFEEVWRSWLEMLNEKGHNLPVTSYQFLKMVSGITANSHTSFQRPRRLVSVDDEVQLKWEYNPRESAYELCREFKYLITSGPRWYGWPYSEDYTSSYHQRVPRSFRKAKVREKKALLRAQRRSTMPGTFPTESEHDTLCEIHWTALTYGGKCKLCLGWKHRQDRLLKHKEYRATLLSFGPPRPTDATIA